MWHTNFFTVLLYVTTLSSWPAFCSFDSALCLRQSLTCWSHGWHALHVLILYINFAILMVSAHSLQPFSSSLTGLTMRMCAMRFRSQQDYKIVVLTKSTDSVAFIKTWCRGFFKYFHVEFVIAVIRCAAWIWLNKLCYRCGAHVVVHNLSLLASQSAVFTDTAHD